MKRYTQIAYSVPLPGRLEELEAWYDNQHIPDVLRLDGFLAATRYRVEGRQAGAAVPPWTVMVIYEIETDDVDATLAQIGRKIRTPELPLTDAIDFPQSLLLLAQPMTRRFTRAA